MSELRILAGQIDVPPTRSAADRDRHIERCAAEIEYRLASKPADLVVLPELSAVEYSRAAFDRLDQLAESADDGPSYRVYGEVAARCRATIVYGIAGVDDHGYTITQVAVGPDGALLGRYDKLHIAHFGASMEKEYFRRGNRCLVIELRGFRVAPLICYDIRFPELARTLVLQHGVDLILHCGAYCRDESFESWHAFVTARAMENQCFVLSLNRAGEQFGDSLFCPPWVDSDHPPLRFDRREETFQAITADRRRIDDTRRRYSFLRDRMEDYSRLETTTVRV